MKIVVDIILVFYIKIIETTRKCIMSNAYIVTGSQDGIISVFTSWKKATVVALKYCGEEGQEVYRDDNDDRAWTVRYFEGWNGEAHIERWYMK